MKEHLTDICDLIKKEGADVGIVVDPDVDRLALIDENGEMFGEEYTLVAVADYLLRHKKGVAVSNLSSSRALRDVARNLDSEYFASAVGEVNVVTLMKEKCSHWWRRKRRNYLSRFALRKRFFSWRCIIFNIKKTKPF